VTSEHGVAAIKPRIEEIVKMLLPEGYLLMQPESATGNPSEPNFPGVYVGTRMRAAYFGAEWQVLPAILRRR
jgi:hypothetical protein